MLIGFGMAGSWAPKFASVTVPLILGSTPGLGAPLTRTLTLASPDGDINAMAGSMSFHGAIAVLPSKENSIASWPLNGTNVPEPVAVSVCSTTSIFENVTPWCGSPCGVKVPRKLALAGTPAAFLKASGIS